MIVIIAWRRPAVQPLQGLQGWSGLSLSGFEGGHGSEVPDSPVMDVEDVGKSTTCSQSLTLFGDIPGKG